MPGVTYEQAWEFAAETFRDFGPDTLVEARNRCYHPCRHCATESERR